MARLSAGLLLYRRRGGVLEIFLAHPGGPFWARKDEGSWTIPKGEPQAGEDLLACARREFTEETGCSIDGSSLDSFQVLPPIRQAGGKQVQAWAIEAECDADFIHSNEFEMEWPPRSGQWQLFPEIDRAAWFDLAAARIKINKAQAALLDALETRLKLDTPPG